MKRIAQDIKEGRFSKIYLLYGEESYLRRQYRDNLRNALIPSDDTMNISMFSGKDINVNEVADLTGTMPFFAERRVIIIENSGWLKNGNERMLEIVKTIPDTTVVIMVEQEVDKRSKLFKAIGSAGYAALCEMQDEATLKKWILGLLKKENKLITADALNLLLDRTGTNMENIRKEVEKLICYKYYDEGITARDVEALCVVQVQNKIFEMVESVAKKEQKRALELYYDLLALKEAPMKILALIARQFNMLLQVRELKKKGYSEADIAKSTGLNAYYLKKKYIPQAAQFKMKQLEDALKACVEAEEAVKTGRMSDVLSVELIIVGLSSRKDDLK
ncbi:MAG: DNA polymerase III subunit delta [Lachnospiraceae bacterium]|nr:DNA polymerase III subunit delta [Lachnospiraceae bacterium]MBQ1993359.1 DNA polymerase III subunit delta [Lachnospiraceae bacterium]MBQ5850180.1 DNA polymerase III subunit delta [Lachnospiraceae bacterium]MEE0920629.1 DNA polymerase III subunit delta [Lachnospiraceae bacterium]